MLAYLFWHRPGPDGGRRDYERHLVGFHAALAGRGYTTAAFRLERLPFAERDGYEDWYLIDDWSALGVLAEAAVDLRSRPAHDAVAGLSAHGWGGVYRLAGGEPIPLSRARWRAKPAGAGYAGFIEGLGEATVWQRQLVLGPAPEFCVEDRGAPERERVWPK